MKVNFTGEDKPRRAGPLSGTTSLTIVSERLHRRPTLSSCPSRG